MICLVHPRVNRPIFFYMKNQSFVARTSLRTLQQLFYYPLYHIPFIHSLGNTAFARYTAAANSKNQG